MILFSLTSSKWVNFINLKIIDFFEVVFSNRLSKFFFCKKKKKKKKIMSCPRPKYFFLVYQIFCLKKSDYPWFLFSLESITSGELHLGKLHRERAVTGRIFQALSTQTDTTTVVFSSVTKNDLLWVGVCPGRPALAALPCLSPQIDRHHVCFYI